MILFLIPAESTSSALVYPLARPFPLTAPLDGAGECGYNDLMARTRGTRGSAKRRERPLGTAIYLGLTATIGVGLVILLAQLLLPGSFMREYFELLRHSASATLPLSPLYQQLSEEVAREEALFATPFSLLCGGLVLGRFAPRYAARRRVLVAGALMAFGILAVSLTFLWVDTVYTTDLLNKHEGGTISHATAPLTYLLPQALWGLAWIAACVLGAWLGLWWRDRRVLRGSGKGVPPPTRPASREVAHR